MAYRRSLAAEVQVPAAVAAGASVVATTAAALAAVAAAAAAAVAVGLQSPSVALALACFQVAGPYRRRRRSVACRLGRRSHTLRLKAPPARRGSTPLSNSPWRRNYYRVVNQSAKVAMHARGVELDILVELSRHCCRCSRSAGFEWARNFRKSVLTVKSSSFVKPEGESNSDR